MTNFMPLHKTNFFKLLLDNFYFCRTEQFSSGLEIDFFNNIPVGSQIKRTDIMPSSEGRIILRSKSCGNLIVIVRDIPRDNWMFCVLGESYTPHRIGKDYLSHNILKYELKPRPIEEFESQVLLHICVLNPSFMDNEMEKIRTKCKFVSLGCFGELSVEPGIHQIICRLIFATSAIYPYLIWHATEKKNGQLQILNWVREEKNGQLQVLNWVHENSRVRDSK